jgi:hypothetical protein
MNEKEREMIKSLLTNGLLNNDFFMMPLTSHNPIKKIHVKDPKKMQNNKSNLSGFIDDLANALSNACSDTKKTAENSGEVLLDKMFEDVLTSDLKGLTDKKPEQTTPRKIFSINPDGYKVSSTNINPDFGPNVLTGTGPLTGTSPYVKSPIEFINTGDKSSVLDDAIKLRESIGKLQIKEVVELYTMEAIELYTMLSDFIEKHKKS